MPRLPRVSMQGVLYYITCHAPERKHLFKDDEDYRAYIRLLAETRQTHVVSLFAYVLLPTHLHLVIELGPGSSISEIMQNVNNAYTKYFNAKYRRKGRVFRGRYGISYVEKEPYLVRLTRHVHLNGRALRLSETAGAYRYSSCEAYLAGAGPEAVPETPDLREEVKEVLGRLETATPEAYRAVLDEEDERERDLHGQLHRGGIVGSDEFIATMKERMERAKANGENAQLAGPAAVVAPAGRSAERSARARQIFLGAAAASVAAMILGGAFLFTRTRTVARTVEEDIERKYQLLLLEKELELRRRERELAEERKNDEGYAGTRVVNVGGRETLDGSIWTIRMTKASAPAVARDDTLTFRDGKVTSAKLLGVRYPTSNYSVTKRDSRRVVWETMQTGKDHGVVFWKGEVSDGDMRGVMIWKRPDGKTDTFSFVSTKVEFPL